MTTNQFLIHQVSQKHGHNTGLREYKDKVKPAKQSRRKISRGVTYSKINGGQSNFLWITLFERLFVTSNVVMDLA